MCLYVTFSSFSVLYHFEHDRPFFQLEHVSSFIQDQELIAVNFSISENSELFTNNWSCIIFCLKKTCHSCLFLIKIKTPFLMSINILRSNISKKNFRNSEFFWNTEMINWQIWGKKELQFYLFCISQYFDCENKFLLWN